MQVLKAANLVKSYKGRRVVNDVTLRIRQGEVVGLLGPNGAGKTTTFYILVGLTSPDRGQVFLDGREITDLPMYLRARSGISYLPQEPSVFRKLSVDDNILAILETLPYTRAQRRKRLDDLIEELGLIHVRKNLGDALSGGERRRVEIARSLVISPSFILLDEPFAGIDPIAVLDIQRIVNRLRAKGIGVLITDHNVREILRVTDRAYIINDGKILQAGTPQELALNQEVKRLYLGENFRLE
ncbi:MAG: LPS export ABC transporter ATP-binding protein [Acidobacteriota bacterium]|nr:LPS export ABC transporter ATP-binding protein [Acidobacteriota bacterium]